MIAGAYNDAVGTTTTLARWTATVQNIYGLSVENYNSGVAAILGQTLGSGTGPALQGISPSGWGAFGTSTSSYGVVGSSASTAGVYGVGGFGVDGVSNNASNAGIGVHGSATAGHGVYGQTTSGNGVTGGSATGNGVYGTASGSGVGVRADSGSGYALFASVGNNTAAVYGVANAGSAIYGSSSGGNAGAFSGPVVVTGPVSITGNFSATGTKSAVVPHPDGTHRKVFCMESPISYFEDFGQAGLVDGVAHVSLDPDFAALVRTDQYHVFLTPNGDCRGLYVAERESTGFTVRELQGGTSSLNVSYRVVAERADVETGRLEAVLMPQVPALEPPPPVDMAVIPATEPMVLPELPVQPRVHAAASPARQGGVG